MLADFNEKDLKSLKSQISSELYKELTRTDNHAIPHLCVLFDIDSRNEDASETAKAIIKRFKDRFKKLVDLDDETEPVAEKLDVSLIDLGSPPEEVARDVESRLVFLLEINTSISYQSEVTKIANTSTKASRFRHKRMVTIMERQEEEEDALSQ